MREAEKKNRIRIEKENEKDWIELKTESSKNVTLCNWSFVCLFEVLID